MGLLRVVLFLTSLTFAIASPPSSTFIEDGSGTTNVTISLNVPSDSSSNDLFFRVTAPAGQSWIAFGFGTQMANSLIFVSYASKDGNTVTISPRTATGHTEPKYDPSIQTLVESGSGIVNGTYIINGRCTNCTKWASGSVDTNSSEQPLIYAVGPAEDKLASDDLDAKIEQHTAHGKFTMDLKQATGEGGVPTATTTETGVKHLQDDDDESNHVSNALHGLIMAASFVILFPTGAVFLRVLGKVWLHWLTQLGTVFCVLIGMALGIYISIKHDSHSHLNTAHQAIGLALVFALLIQLTLGFLHHTRYRKNHLPTIMGKIHRYVGPTIILVGIINGALGFNLAGHNRVIITYCLVATVVALVLFSVSFLKLRRNKKKADMDSVPTFNAAYEPQYGGAIPLASQAAPPAYAVPPAAYPPPGSAPTRYQ